MTCDRVGRERVVDSLRHATKGEHEAGMGPDDVKGEAVYKH